MRHPTLILLLLVIAAMAVGVLVGWRARISTEEVFYHPIEWQHLKPPPNLGLVWP